MSGEDTSSAVDRCPVDHGTQERWLEAARATAVQTSTRPSGDNHPPSNHLGNRTQRFSLDTGRWHNHVPQLTISTARPAQPLRLPTDREVSTIPRSIVGNEAQHSLNTAERAALPANSELDTGHDRGTGNWVYPSQEMFFSAMRRKGHEAIPSDMASVVPIHNAVNERAWKEIKEWEMGRGSEKCGGPALVSFAGDSKALTPRARWNTLLGYHAPFDRHDWVIDRCGQKIDYVIDFYAGKEDKGLANQRMALNFYLDVRPRLNSWEGFKTRISRTLGL